MILCLLSMMWAISGVLRMKPSKMLLAALLLGLWLPSQAEAAAFPTAGMKGVSSDFVEAVRYRGAVARSGAAVGPRGGAVAGRRYAARGPRGAVAGRSYVARGPRGNVVAGRTVVARPGYRPVPARAWVRPTSYWWRPGMAVVSGAAIGFVAAATASAYASSPAPAPGHCWYYTNPQRTQGFWDACPR